MPLTQSVVTEHLLTLRNKLWPGGALPSVGRGLIFGAGATGLLRIAFTALSFLVNILLARLLSPAGYGAYSYAIAVVGLLSVFALFGMDMLLTQRVAVYHASQSWGHLRGLLRRSIQAGLALSLVLGLAAGLFVLLLRPTLPRDTVLCVLLSLTLLPLIVLARLRQAAMQGLQRLLAGQIPELLLQPLLLLALLAGLLTLYGQTPTAPAAMGVTVLAWALAVMIGAALLRSALPRETRAAAPRYAAREWLRQAVPFLLSSSCWVISSRADVLLLGALRGNDAVGLYSAATRSAELIAFFLTTFNVALAPAIARMHAAGDLAALQHTVTTGTRVVFLLSLPVVVFFIAFGSWWLQLYGGDFSGAHLPLMILAVGQTVNVGMGSVGLLLNMTGHERDAAAIVAVAAVWNVVGNAVLISLFGLVGAACASAGGMILWNVLMVRRVHQRTGIHSTALGIISPRRGTA